MTILSLGIVPGPALASLLFFTIGICWAIFFNALSFIVSFITTLAMRPPALPAERAESQRQNFWQDLTEGMRLVFQSRVLRTILLACVVEVMYEGAFGALGVFLSSSISLCLRAFMAF